MVACSVEGLFAPNSDVSPFFVSGPTVSPNYQPTLEITTPTGTQSVGRGDRLLITWEDSDTDSAALISFDLININTSNIFNVVNGIEENDELDSWSADTEVIPIGSYNLRGQISDASTSVDSFAESDQAGGGRVVITVTGEGETPANQPPQLDVVVPQFNQAVSQDDTLVVQIRPVDFDPNVVDPNQGNPGAIPYDLDSATTVLIMLDLDNDPTNDDPFNPDAGGLILLLPPQTIPLGEVGTIQFNITVDVATIPVRSDGSPYYVRATISDLNNPPLNVYADGTINVVQAASGVVDLGTIGKTLSGARFTGFNPRANLGSNLVSIGDFDDDGVDDFILVAQFGNPRNRGEVGQAYLIYGQANRRFGGDNNANSTSSAIPGVIFDAGPLRPELGLPNPRSDGLTSVASIGDLDGDGRPEILFGQGHVDGVFEGRDDDPGDDPPTGEETASIDIIVREGLSSIIVDDGNPTSSSYNAAQDTYLNSADPNANFGSSTELEWLNAGPNDSSWTLLKFADILGEVPDEAFRINNLGAMLRIRIVNTGGNATLHQLFADFNENTVTFNSNEFSVEGAAPAAGVDYDAESLGAVNGDASGDFAEIDVTGVVQQLVDGQLDDPDTDNELRFIIVPDDDADNSTRFRSSEFSDVPDQRPTLFVSYERFLFGSAFGCYPDLWVNNLATAPPATEDDSIQALGYTVIMHSTNRDNFGLVNPDRLENTAIDLEGVGEQWDSNPQDILFLAEAAEPSRIAGARFIMGGYDWIDHRGQNQPPLNDRSGWTVASLPDMDNDQLPEIMISAPTNELDYDTTVNNFGSELSSTQVASRVYTGSIVVIPGTNYDLPFWRDKPEASIGNAVIPAPIDPRKQIGTCGGPDSRNFDYKPDVIGRNTFEVFGEDLNDFLGGAQSGGDFNLDGVPDILCGAPGNDPGSLLDAGAIYILYGRISTGDYDLRNGVADNPALRPPMLRIFGETDNDQFGGELIRGDVRVAKKAGFIRQISGRDVNGDRIDDVVIGAPRADFGGVEAPSCGGDYDQDGVVDADDLDENLFASCLASFGDEVFLDDPCKVFDYDNDRQITEDQTRNYDDDGMILNDLDVLQCLIADGDNCCPVDNGFVAVIFGGTTINGDFDISQIATDDLPGVRFYGANPGDRAGMDIGSAGDFNQDGFGDILIAAPGVIRSDANLRVRMGVVYVIFGGRHLYNREFNLQEVGTQELPGVILMSPYVVGRPNEAPPDHVGLLGDINNDGFDDIAVGITSADFVDETLPQDLNSPVTESSAGRIPNTGDVFIIYGNNFGSNTIP